eukprot:CAMPEP_0119567430 /NCGR_PEP_ID=MMETSP1352-20130426/35878_1 /TAXON_ID=265584 /ORGANISM="Stauroneis constricta, Strain CCMP1120" /LENGTH=36 /DNA_ID= /DNA_START= /DNA_END= /DNA_ORIENTATION=
MIFDVTSVEQSSLLEALSPVYCQSCELVSPPTRPPP